MRSSVKQDWAQVEFGAAELGDARRAERLADLARVLAERPEASLPQALANGAALKAAYRFFDNADIAHEKILASHVASSLNRLKEHTVVLAVQDTTFIDYPGHVHTQGLGPMHDKGGWGMLCHDTLAFTPSRLPLGVLGLRLWARDPKQPRRRTTRRKRPIKDKESYKWIDSVEAVAALKAQLPNTRVVSVADRESDVFEFFTAARALGVDALTRAPWDRNVTGPEDKLFPMLAAAPVVAHKLLAVSANGKRHARTARLKIRTCALTLESTMNGTGRGLEPIALWGVWAHEPNPPAGVEPLDWKLLTSVPVISADVALERLEWYAARWSIEQWHKMLKSGCRIEQRQLESFDRLSRLLTAYAVLAWRLLYATMLARLAPNVACTAILSVPTVMYFETLNNRNCVSLGNR